MGHRKWQVEKQFIEDNVHTLSEGKAAYYYGCKYEMKEGAYVYKERRDRASSRLVAIVKNGVATKV